MLYIDITVDITFKAITERLNISK